MTWQAVEVQYPDIELWVTGFLRGALAVRPEPFADAVYISNKVPKQRRDHMVIVRRDGGTVRNLLDVARVSVQVWCPTEQEATDLARLTQALLCAARTGPVVRVSLNSGPSPVPDSSGASIRYMVFDIYARGGPIT